jgi:LemA protein
LTWLFILVALLLLAAGVFIGFYNRFVTLRNRCHEAWSNVDTELKRRYDLIPNLVETVRGYAKHERDVLEAVTAARTRAMAPHQDAGDQARDERPLVAALKSLFAVAEAYPTLKSSRNFLQLQNELAITEDRIQAARRFYNGNVRDLRNATRSFPGLLFVRLYKVEGEPYFEVEPLAVVRPDVKILTERTA